MCSRNPVVTLGVSDRSRCGAVRLLISLEKPSSDFGRVRSLWLRRGAAFDIACALCVSDRCGRCGCGAAMILADALRSWQRDLRSSLEGPITTILQRVS